MMFDPTPSRPRDHIPLSRDETQAAWARLGIGFTSPMAELERSPALVTMESIGHLSGFARLFHLTVTWIAAYPDLLDEKELKQDYRKIVKPEDRPKLALLLETALQPGDLERFKDITEGINPAPIARPLFDVMNKDEYRRAKAQQNSSALGHKWGLWVDSFDPSEYGDTIRPREWILRNNPGLI